MTEENTELETTEHEAADAPDIDADVEAEAREKGWKPEEEWAGDKSRWMPADEFLAFNERRLQQADGIAKAEISRLEKEVAELKSGISDLTGHLKKADQRAYERARKDLEAEMKNAVADGDTEAFERISDDLKALDKEVADATTEKPKDDASTGNSPAFREWHKDNDWYGNNVRMTVFADEAARVIRAANPRMGEADLYEAVSKEVREEFPDRFKNTRRTKPPVVEGASNGGGGGSGALWSKVDKEGRESFERFVKMGVFNDSKEDREKYARDYVEG